jgi:hypothetical protein
MAKAPRRAWRVCRFRTGMASSMVLAMGAPKRPSTLRRELRTELPRLIREDIEVRGQVIAVLSEYLTTREETAAILAELRQMRAEFEQRMDEQGRRMDEQGRRIEEQGRRIEEQGRRIEEQGRRIAEHTRALGAIGARWGMMTEEAFRNSVRVLFADQPEVRIEHWRHHDSQGKVFGYPSDVDIDVVIRDGTLVLIEIKSSISSGDVTEFAGRVDLYREVTGRSPARLLMLGPHVDERAREVAARLGIEVVSSTTPPRI